MGKWSIQHALDSHKEIKQADRIYRFVEHASLAVLILGAGTVDEAVTEDVVVDATVSAHQIGRRTSEAFHAVFGRRALCKQTNTSLG